MTSLNVFVSVNAGRAWEFTSFVSGSVNNNQRILPFYTLFPIKYQIPLSQGLPIGKT